MKMTLQLNAPGMTSLHKAGLAGLYMTLRALERQHARRQKQQVKQDASRPIIDGLKWTLAPKQVELEWEDAKLKDAFTELINKSFSIDKEGFIRLAGLEPDKEPSPAHKHHLYIALLNSFLQFGPHRPTESKRTLTYEVDDKPFWIKEFAPIKEFRHRDAVKDFIEEDKEKKAHFKPAIEAAGWLYPGGGQRHVAHNNTKLNEGTEQALALLFASVGVVYFTLRSRSRGRKARLAMLIPEIQHLELYAEMRDDLATQSVRELTASGASDAALRLLTMTEGKRAGNEFAQESEAPFICRVVTFGIVGWNEKQKSRTSSYTVVSGEIKGMENYNRAMAIFPNPLQRSAEERNRKDEVTKPESYFITTYSAREFIADNIAHGNVWYHDLAGYMNTKEAREALTTYEKKEMAQMVKEAVFDTDKDTGSERLFVQVCHESWRRRMGKLGERARRENTNFNSLVNKESERLRTSLMRSKNADTLRETVVDFWARSGTNEHLQGDGLAKLLPFFDEKIWRRTRDLTLLALISYQPNTPEEAVALNPDLNVNVGDIDNQKGDEN